LIDELDGVVAAPDHHKVLFENDQVRALETAIHPGDRTALHTHLRPTLNYVVSGFHFRRWDGSGAVVVDTRADPSFVLPRVLFIESLPPRTLQNTGDDDLVLIGVELKQGEMG
jgi:hypothetical protein